MVPFDLLCHVVDDSITVAEACATVLNECYNCY